MDVELHCYVSCFVMGVSGGIFLGCLLSVWWDLCGSLTNVAA